MKPSFSNPVTMARNAIGAVTLMSLINVMLVYFNLPPIMPLSLTMPISFAVMAFRTPESIVELYPDPAQLAFFRQVSLVWVVVVLAVLAYAFWRMTKKPKAVKIGLVVVVMDTIALTTLYPIASLGFVIEALYHGLVIFYLFKGLKAIGKESAHV
jgi:hypothetical protein